MSSAITLLFGSSQRRRASAPGARLPRNPNDLQWAELVADFDRLASQRARRSARNVMLLEIYRQQRSLSVYSGAECVDVIETPLFSQWTNATVDAVVRELTLKLFTRRATETRLHVSASGCIYLTVADAAGRLTLLIDPYASRGPIEDTLPAAVRRYVLGFGKSSVVTAFTSACPVSRGKP